MASAADAAAVKRKREGGDDADGFTLHPGHVGSRPPPGLSVPTLLQFSPDDSVLACLHAPDESLSKQLMAVDLASFEHTVLVGGGGDDESTLSLEEKLRRERARNMAVGVTQYAWIPRSDAATGAALDPAILIPQGGNLYVWLPDTRELTLLFDKASTGAAGGALDAQLSPDGTRVAFVQDGEVYVIPSMPSPAAGGAAAAGAAPKGVVAAQVTSGARAAGRTNGVADFLAMEEMDRYTGFWWSADGNSIAFEEVDEAHIPLYRIAHQGKDFVGEGAEEEHRYPFAGAANPHVRLGVVKAPAAAEVADPDCARSWHDDEASTADATTWMDLGEEVDIYLARVDWLPDGTLAAQVQSRDQQTLRLLRFPGAASGSGAAVELLRETSESWINLHDSFAPLPMHAAPPGGAGGLRFVWRSERSGWAHLYLYEVAEGGAATLVRALTTGAGWCVDEVVGVDVARGAVYFSGTADVDKLPETHVYACPLWAGADSGSDRGACTRLTTEAGTHQVSFSSDYRTFVDTWSSLTAPPRTQVCRLEDGEAAGGSDAAAAAVSLAARLVHTLYEASDESPEADRARSVADKACEAVGKAAAEAKAAAAASGAAPPPAAEPWLPTRVPLSFLVPPTPIVVPTRHDFTLNGLIYVPDASVHGEGPYPTAVSVYGGPGVQWAANAWRCTAELRAQALCRAGFLVVKVDNRGTPRRGVAFESALYRRMGTVEVEDQVDAVAHLVSKGLADPARVGVYGWSYGGYMTLMCLARAPHVFCAGVSGAPVTHWDGYDTHYTERYMATPATNPEGYRDGAVMTHAVAGAPGAAPGAGIRGRLMLVHGLIDENVHFRHTARLINTLIAARIDYDLMLFPEERHSPRREGDRAYMEMRIARFLVDNVMHPRPSGGAGGAASAL